MCGHGEASGCLSFLLCPHRCLPFFLPPFLVFSPFSFLSRLPPPLPTPVLHTHLLSPSHPPRIPPTLLVPLSAFHLPPATPQMIDGEAFLLLTQADIVKIMSVKLGPALKIYNAILMFKTADDTLK